MEIFGVLFSIYGLAPIFVAMRLNRLAEERYSRTHPARTVTALIQLVMLISWTIYAGGFLGMVGNIPAVVLAFLVHTAMTVFVALAMGRRNDGYWFFKWLELKLKAPQPALSNDKNKGFEA